MQFFKGIKEFIIRWVWVIYLNGVVLSNLISSKAIRHIRASSSSNSSSDSLTSTLFHIAHVAFFFYFCQVILHEKIVCHNISRTLTFLAFVIASFLSCFRIYRTVSSFSKWLFESKEECKVFIIDILHITIRRSFKSQALLILINIIKVNHLVNYERANKLVEFRLG